MAKLFCILRSGIDQIGVIEQEMSEWTEGSEPERISWLKLIYRMWMERKSYDRIAQEMITSVLNGRANIRHGPETERSAIATEQIMVSAGQYS